MYKIMMSGTVIGLFLQVVPITCIVGSIYTIYRLFKIKRRSLSVIWTAEFIRWLFVCYLTGLINLVLVPNNFWTYIWFYLKNGYAGCEIDPLFSGGFNLVPTLIKCLTGELTIGHWVKTMLTLNLLMFIPMGFFSPFISEKVCNRNILKIAIAVPLAVEVIQFVVGRSFDVDDLILNFIGIIIGYFIAAIIKSLIKKKA